MAVILIYAVQFYNFIFLNIFETKYQNCGIQFVNPKLMIRLRIVMQI